MTGRITALGACALAAIVASGCLVKETTETWYVNPSGEVTVVMLEKDVRSDARTVVDRQTEENEYWLAVQQQRHPVAAGLLELGGNNLKTVVLRGEAPYTVQTEARFTGLDELGRRLIASTGVMGTSIVTHDGPTWDWTLTVRDPSSPMSATEPSDNVGAVTMEMDVLRVVLTSGRFEKAEGFDLSNDGRVATLNMKEQPAADEPEMPTVTLRLVWRTPPS
jgi:hypothetical protein